MIADVKGDFSMKKRTISIGMILCMILSLITGVGYSVSGGETQAAKKKKVLVVYFTRADNVQSKKALDASSSASIQISGKKRFGNAEMLARKIRKQTGGDIRSIRMKEKYTNDYDELGERAEKELEGNARPALATRPVSIKKYDAVVLCFPVWNDMLPMAFHTFLDACDFSGKNVYVCATHEGSGFGDSIRDAKRLCKGASVKKGFSAEADSVKKADKKIKRLAQQIQASR